MDREKLIKLLKENQQVQPYGELANKILALDKQECLSENEIEKTIEDNALNECMFNDRFAVLVYPDDIAEELSGKIARAKDPMEGRINTYGLWNYKTEQWEHDDKSGHIITFSHMHEGLEIIKKYGLSNTTILLLNSWEKQKPQEPACTCVNKVFDNTGCPSHGQKAGRLEYESSGYFGSTEADNKYNIQKCIRAINKINGV